MQDTHQYLPATPTHRAVRLMPRKIRLPRPAEPEAQTPAPEKQSEQSTTER
jgi:hypothetical protein